MCLLCYLYQVTVAGFEPLLKFAYTSKLHFGKDDVLEIQNAVSILGFRDLDEACFDFLLPKFFSSNKGSAPFVRKTCCKKTCKRQLSAEKGGTDSDEVPLDNKEVKPVADSSSQQDVTRACSKSVSKITGSLNNAKSFGTAVEDMDGIFQQCPKYRKFQQAWRKELDTEKSPADPVKPVIEDGCFFSCFPCPSSAQCKIKTSVLGNSASSKRIKGDAKEPREAEVQKAKADISVVTWAAGSIKTNAQEREEKIEENVRKMKEKMMEMSSSDTLCVKIVTSEPNPRLGESPAEVVSPTCPLGDFSDSYAICRPLGYEMVSNTKKQGTADPGAVHQNGPIEAEVKWIQSLSQDGGNGKQTGKVERERITSQQNIQDPEVGYSTDAGGKWVESSSLLEWPKLRDNFCSTNNSCSLLLDQDQGSCAFNPAGMSECEAASQSGGSSLNSGEDGDSETETEVDCEFFSRERARQVRTSAVKQICFGLVFFFFLLSPPKFTMLL